MTLVSLTDCSHLLAVDPKTLRHWMHLSHLSPLAHPLDARRKCLTHEQLQQLAAAHHRTLATQVLQPEACMLPPPTPAVGATALSDVRPHLAVTPLSMIMHLLALLLKRLGGRCIVRKGVISPDFSGPLSDLTKQLACLQVHVVTLQCQLTLLTDQLQNERQWRASVAFTPQTKSQESSLDLSLGKPQQSSLDLSQEKSQESSLDLSLGKPQQSSLDLSQEKSQQSSLDLSLGKPQQSSSEKMQARASIDEHRRSRVLPWVEYGALGKYVVICPERGLLEFEPDSPEWFAWLSGLSSFRFMGKLGRFTAHRGGSKSPKSSWYATRSIRNRSYSHPLGRTEGLTVAHLEQVAAVLQSHLN